MNIKSPNGDYEYTTEDIEIMIIMQQYRLKDADN